MEMKSFQNKLHLAKQQVSLHVAELFGKVTLVVIQVLFIWGSMEDKKLIVIIC